MRWQPILAVLGLSLWAGPGAAQDIINCNRTADLSAVGPYAASDSAARCRLWPGSNSDFKLYYPANWGAEPRGARAARLAAIADAVRDSLREYRALGFLDGATTHPIHVAYAPGDDPDPDPDNGAAEAITDADRPTRHCDMMIYGGGPMGSLELPKFKQVIAHEMFHCVQIFAFPQRYAPAAYWWQEGSAEMASGLVYPSVNMEYDWTSAYQQDHVLFDHDYATALFFQDYANRRGIPALIALLKRMPDSRDPNDQYATLSSLEGFNESFHQFGEDYMDRAIADPGGGMMAQPEPGARDQYPISESGALTLSTTTFILDAYILRLDKGRRFRISGLGPEGDDVAVSWRYAGEPGRWTRARPGGVIETETDCDGPKRIFVLLTSTRNSPEFIDYTIHADVEEKHCETCECAGPVPACAVGSWHVRDASQWDPYWARIAEMMRGAATFTQQRGEIDLDITRGGRFSESAAYEATGEMASSPGITITTRISAIGSGTICLTADNQLCRTYSDSSILKDTEFRKDGAVVMHQSGPMPPNTVVKHPYECRPGELTIPTTYPLDPPLTVDFRFSH